MDKKGLNLYSNFLIWLWSFLSNWADNVSYVFDTTILLFSYELVYIMYNKSGLSGLMCLLC